METFFKQGAHNVDYVHLCMCEPYEEDEEFGIVAWLDVSEFDSELCLNFRPK